MHSGTWSTPIVGDVMTNPADARPVAGRITHQRGILSTMFRSTASRFRCLRFHAVLGIGAILLAATGCQQSLFPKDAPRHQFQTHQQMRGQYTPTQQPDVFGNPQPALRARLSQQR